MASDPLQDQHIDVTAMRDLLDGRYRDVRNRVRENLVKHASILDEAETLSRDDYRDKVRDVVIELSATGQTGYGLPKEYGGGGDIGASVAAFETSAFGDLSVLVKLGVQFGLFGGAVLQLGTERHHKKYMADIATGALLGAFAMTETGHGSNVQALGTYATYDPETQEFVLQTKDDSARLDVTGVTDLQDSLWNSRQDVRFPLNPFSDSIQSVAGFASLHVGLTLTIALVAHYTVRHRPLRIAAWVYCFLTLISTMYFGWHYIADDIGGVVIALLAVYLGGIATGQRFDRYGRASHPTTSTADVPVEEDDEGDPGPGARVGQTT